MEGQTPNINVIHSVWRRLKKAKIRDLQPIKDVKGGGRVTRTSRPTTGGTGTAGNRGSRQKFGVSSGGDCFTGFARIQRTERS
jgi:hypothetical protein